MLNPNFISNLKLQLSPQSRILADSATDDFKESLLRWSDIDLEVPGTIVRLAAQYDVAFVPKSGGHSLWSTIGAEGFIIDLARLKKISVDKPTGQITVQSGVFVKEANDAAFENGLCLPLGSANTAGVIPMALGGGLSGFSPICGCTSDNIVSARLVTADGTLLTVSESSHPELFWALRGAGQFFGLITKLTLRGHPLSILGTGDGTIWTGSIRSLTTQLLRRPAFSSPPPAFETLIMIFPFYFGHATEAEAFYKPLLDLSPLMSDLKNVSYNRMNDICDPFCSKGGFKRFAGAGATTFKPEVWPRILEYYKTKCPDARATAYAFEWESYVPKNKPPAQDTAFRHKDIRVWAATQETLWWYTDPVSHGDVFRIEQEVLAYFRSQYDGMLVTYQNWSRDVPLEQLYRDTGTLGRLRLLKKEWDPKGVFTKLLL
ncbi:hypothetical protein GGX14DRAFT_550574 [Mycena pura]|uniref:FAD-binding PCMH-type domain-containing protein n=1 Tax=Mycena pura TaxID=153505 RepID=A0AAD6VIW8_9AGAR|nr:hypothetical protein GGX14DRAFT_550574 [Mycena pura]